MKSTAGIRIIRLVILFGLLVWGTTLLSNAKFIDLSTSQKRDDILLTGSLDQTASVGQTFVSQKPYLASIKLVLNSYPGEQVSTGNPHIFFYLYDTDRHPIAFVSRSIPNQAENLEMEFSFPPQPNSLHKAYYFLIKTDAPAKQISIWSSLYDAYPNGSIDLNGNPQPYDLTFWTYDKPPFFAWAKETFAHAGIIFADLFLISFLFLAPGFLIYQVLGGKAKDPIERIIYSLSIGIVAPSILFMVMKLIGVKITPTAIWIVLAVLIASFGIKVFLSYRTQASKQVFPKVNYREVIFLGLLFMLAAFSRASQINDIVVPSWVDGIVHQQFLTRILERQAIAFDAIYPKGFHSAVVFEHLLLGGSLSESILLMGQWLSLVSGLTFYLLARNLLRWPYGLLAAAVYWFGAAFPAFLVNWSRYPYLQGLVLLPVAVETYRNTSADPRSKYILLTLLSIGMGLTYYGVLLIFFAYVIVDLIHRIQKDGISEILGKILVIALPMVPVVIILAIRLTRAVDLRVYGQDANVTLFEDSMHAFQISLQYGGWWVCALGISGLVLALIFNYPKFLILAEWFFVLLSLNFLQATAGITVSSVANSIIFLSIPLALFASLVFKFLLAGIRRNTKFLCYAIIVLFATTGAYNISGIVQPSNILYLQADQKAMEWIEQKTPANSVFLINKFQWGDDPAPSDGGGWISYIANRNSILFDENRFEKVIMDRQIDYVYLGLGYGDIDQDMLINDNRFSLVYDQDGIRILKLNPAEK